MQLQLYEFQKTRGRIINLELEIAEQSTARGRLFADSTTPVHLLAENIDDLVIETNKV